MTLRNSADISAMRLALQRAQAAAENNDIPGLLKEVLSSPLFEGFRKFFRRKFDVLSEEDIKDAIGDALYALCDKINKGGRIAGIDRYLWKVVDAQLAQSYHRQKRLRSLQEGHLDIQDSSKYSPKQQEESYRQREKAISVALNLLPKLGSDNVQQVMRYILEALRNGASDIPNTEIAEVLGLNESSVRVWVKRGFEKLTRVAKEENLLEDGAQFKFHEILEVDIEDEEN